MLKGLARSRARVGLVALATIGGASWLSLPGCSSEKSKLTQAPVVVREVPEPLRGTIGSVASIRGVEPQLVSGLGLVVGLNGTGGGELTPQIQVTMERELARGGIGKGGVLDVGPLAGKSPREVLRDPNVAVVIVEAAVSPGWPPGYKFDVRVRTLPGASSVTSLEGGTLWTTELRIGPATTVGAVRQRILGEARGPIFINPFAEPGKPGADAVTRTIGRVLNGGLITEPLDLEVVLDNPSHSTSRAIAAAINSRFPEGPGDDGPTARGRKGDSIAVRVPREYATRPNEFLELLRTTRIDQAYPQEFARRYVDYLKEMPALAEDLSWCLQAVGKPAVPFLPQMYDYAEIGPRMAALRAGAKLGDPRTAPALTELSKTGPAQERLEAINLLARLPGNPRINIALWELVDSPDLDVRVAAYEALRERGDAGIGRLSVDRRFMIESVPSKDGLIYVTQQGPPRIVVFGGGITGVQANEPGQAIPPGPKLSKPLLVTAWGDRLMLAAESPSDPIRVRYQDYRSQQTTTMTTTDDVVKLVELLGHKTTPEEPAPGLGLPYSEVVGALYEIQRQGGISGGFATERDRLLATVLRASKQTVVADRPESSGDDVKPPPGPPLVFKPEATEAAKAEEAQPAGVKKSLVVPLNPGVKKKQ